jgi:hypothetical protein
MRGRRTRVEEIAGRRTRVEEIAGRRTRVEEIAGRWPPAKEDGDAGILDRALFPKDLKEGGLLCKL